MKDYNGFSYKPDYGYKISKDGKVLEECNKVYNAYCFSEVFDILANRRHVYKGIYTLNCRKEFKYQSGNFCALDKIEIFKVLRYMRKAFDIKIYFSETDQDYSFTIHIEGRPVKHKFILTFCRVFFEYPYNEIAKDVFRLRNCGIVNGVNYTHKSFMEVYHLITTRHGNALGMGHSLFRYPSLSVPTKHMHEVFKSDTYRVQDVYPGNYDYYDKIRHIGVPDWDKDFDKRLNSYSEAFEILKRLKQNDKKNIRRRAAKRV